MKTTEKWFNVGYKKCLIDLLQNDYITEEVHDFHLSLLYSFNYNKYEKLLKELMKK